MLLVYVHIYTWSSRGLSLIVEVMFRYVYCTEFFFFFQAEDGIRDLVRSRGLGDVYKRQGLAGAGHARQGFDQRLKGIAVGEIARLVDGHQILSLIHI